MAKVWVITSGCYSDYGITGIFSTRELAEQALGGKEDSDGYGSRIEEFDLDPSMHQMREGLQAWHVCMLRDGTTQKAENWNWIGYEAQIRFVERSKYHWLKEPDCIEGQVWARDQKHAIKIVNEHRLQMIADGRFPPPSQCRSEEK